MNVNRRTLVQILALPRSAGHTIGRCLAVSLAIGGLIVDQWSTLTAKRCRETGQATTYYVGGDFRLPFRVKPGGRCPTELDLLVSRNKGRTWLTHQTASPSASAFEIKQADEGQYWLTVRARDTTAAVLSQRHMVLVVDRTEPEVGLACHWNGQETLVVQCKVEDPNLDDQNIQLEFRSDLQPEFQRLSVSDKSYVNGVLTCGLSSHSVTIVP